MKKLLVIIALCLPALLAAQMTYVPDDNFEQALIDKGYDTPPLNDSVPTKDIENVTHLMIHSRGISDLTGIEDFKILSYLFCSYNQLEKLDLSKNKRIHTVICDSNKLNSINLKNGRTSAIYKMYANYNPDLQCIQVDDTLGNNYTGYDWRYSSNARLSEDCGLIPLSQRTYIPDDNFEQALIDLGYDTAPLNDSVPTKNIFPISNLDVSNLGIAELTGIEDFGNLESFDCSENKIVFLDFSSNYDLRVLNCNTNNLESINLIGNLRVKEFNCSNNKLNALNLRQVPDVQSFNSRNNPDLFCIEVRNPVIAANNPYWYKDAQAIYSEDCSLVSVEEETYLGNEITISPNPAKDYIEISGVVGEVKVYDVLGMEVLTHPLTPSREGELRRIDVSSLNPGVYFVSVGGRMYKFVKM